jgi:hypothetical protein
MPVGGSGKPAGGYRAGNKGSYGCEGYPTVSADGTVHGCHPTKAKAQSQARAIWASVARKSISSVEKSMVSEGDFVMYMGEDDEIMVGRVEYVMTNPGLLGLPGSEYALEYAEDDKPVIVRKYEEEDGAWEEKEYVCYHRMSEVIKIESLSVSVDMVMEMGSSGSGIPSTPEQSDMQNMYDVQMGKAKNPNYEEMIGERRGGSEPSNAQLYARIIREAKDKFDVYPSAVANSWVVQEYKRRGGTYKSEKRERSMETRERMAEAGTAMSDGSFPIANRADLINAIRSVGRAKDYNKAKAHIIGRARALSAMDMLPDDWKGTARKGMTGWDGSVFDLNPFKK